MTQAERDRLVALKKAKKKLITQKEAAEELGPFNVPTECERMIEELGEKPGVVGFCVTAPRYKGVWDNCYSRTYAMLEERNLPLAFHSGFMWGGDRTMELCNRFIAVHALGFTWYNVVHLTNWIVNGMPERYPKLKVLWIESGLAWLPFLAQRLDNEYMMRSFEAPGLKRRPSSYMREMFFSTQPLERPEDMGLLEAMFRSLNAETQLVWGSNFPSPDFDLPSVIYDLPFLGEQAKLNILGGTAAKLFGLPAK